jgi:hypothetical protein
MAAGKGNGYANTRKGIRSDLPVTKVIRSSWEANVLRVMVWLEDAGDVAGWEYESRCLKFPGKDENARGNRIYWPDIPFATLRPFEFAGLEIPKGIGFAFEVKGRLKQGGLLLKPDEPKVKGKTVPSLDLSGLDKAHDSASRIKLERVCTHYREDALKLWVLGAAEYATITKQFKSRIPHWE